MPRFKRYSEFAPDDDAQDLSDIACTRVLAALYMLAYASPQKTAYLHGVDDEVAVRRVLPRATRLLIINSREMIKQANPLELHDDFEQMGRRHSQSLDYLDASVHRVAGFTGRETNEEPGLSIQEVLAMRRHLMVAAFGKPFRFREDTAPLRVVVPVINGTVYHALCDQESDNFGGLLLEQLMGGIALDAELKKVGAVTVKAAHSPALDRLVLSSVT